VTSLFLKYCLALLSLLSCSPDASHQTVVNVLVTTSTYHRQDGPTCTAAVEDHKQNPRNMSFLESLNGYSLATLALVVVAILISRKLAVKMDPMEPTLIPSRIPYIGHAINMLRDQSEYFQSFRYNAPPRAESTPPVKHPNKLQVLITPRIHLEHLFDQNLHHHIPTTDPGCNPEQRPLI